MTKMRSYRCWRAGLAVAAAMLAIAACGSGDGGGGGGGGGDGETAVIDCNAATNSIADSVTVAVNGGTATTFQETLPTSFCIDATYDAEEDTNTISIDATASRAGVTISLEALGPGAYTYGPGNGIGQSGLQYHANSASNIIYLTADACTNDAAVNLNTYSTRLTGDYTATLFAYEIGVGVDCGDTITVAGSIDVARSEFTYPASLGDTECAVGANEICFVINGGTPVTYQSGVDGDAFEVSYNTSGIQTTIATDMTDSVANPDLEFSFKAAANGTYRYLVGSADVLQRIGSATPPTFTDSYYISNQDDGADDCGTSTIQVTQYGSVGGQIVGRFVAELFEYDFDGSLGAPHEVYCDAAHRRVIYGAFNVARGANTSD